MQHAQIIKVLTANKKKGHKQAKREGKTDKE
jgi:hypothetical protein